MAYLVIVVNSPNDSVAELNARCQFPTKIHESIDACSQYLEKVNSGNKPASVQVTVTAVNPSIPAPSDPGSSQDLYSHL